MKNSLTDEPELCFYAKTTRRRQNFEKVGLALFLSQYLHLFGIGCSFYRRDYTCLFTVLNSALASPLCEK
jgi:hypothetical protein